MTKTIHFLSILAIAVILIGSISVGSVAFADEDDDDEDDDDNNGPKTFESKCAKKKPTSFDGLVCTAIFALQDAIADLQAQIDEISIEPDETGGLTTYTKVESVNPDPLLGFQQSVIVNCDLGDVALGGGGNTVQLTANFEASTPHPQDPLQISTGWNATFSSEEFLVDITSRSLEAWVICADLTP